jgi:peptide/nickel transport system ATP-binding protein
MEEAPAKDLNKNRLHPYTKLLFNSVTGAQKPLLDSAAAANKTASPALEVVSVRGELIGCAFAHRCVHADERCSHEKPPMQHCGNNHYSACFKTKTL